MQHGFKREIIRFLLSFFLLFVFFFFVLFEPVKPVNSLGGDRGEVCILVDVLKNICTFACSNFESLWNTVRRSGRDGWYKSFGMDHILLQWK
jgi:hypothetical protein